MSQSADVATKRAEVITRCRTASPTKCRPIPGLGLPGQGEVWGIRPD
jgi:hypothetical protein